MGIGSVLTVQNPGTPFDQAWIDLAPQSASFDAEAPVPSREDLRLIASLMDLTSLNSDDSREDILNLFDSAFEPLPGENVKVAAVCIFPEFLGLAGTWVRSRGVRLATVAGDFPHGLGPLESRCREIALCAKMADEVDFPIDRRLALAGRWEELYWETREMVRAARGVPTKVILATGELPDQPTIYRAASVAMMAGATFVKTSTGKERVNARLDAGAIMCRAIKDYLKRTGCKVGLKPAGGIRSTNEAMGWLQLVRSKLGDEWVMPELFRIGASSLLEHLRYAFD
jgi:deoxyribose-phosphate aldolase